MSVYNIDGPTTKARLGGLMSSLDSTFLRIQQFNTFLNTITDANLTSLYGIPQSDINIMRSALTDIEQLRTVYQGAATLATAKDFRTFAAQTYAFGSF